ncbi:MAG: hypothetical protein R2827_08895 [Bdellovibrionales bacterium]
MSSRAYKFGWKLHYFREVGTGATFVHNNGRVELAAREGWAGGSPIFVMDVPTTLTLYDLEFDGAHLHGTYRGTHTIAAGDTPLPY